MIVFEDESDYLNYIFLVLAILLIFVIYPIGFYRACNNKPKEEQSKYITRTEWEAWRDSHDCKPWEL